VVISLEYVIDKMPTKVRFYLYIFLASPGVNPPPPAAVNSHEQVDYESKNESFIGEWSDDDEEEEEEDGETEEAGSGPPPQRRVVTQSSRTRKQYAETIHVSVR
jgi:hypothetical protein